MSLIMTEKEIVTIDLEKASEEELIAVIAKLADILEEKREAAGVSKKDVERGNKGYKEKRRHHSKKKFRKFGRDFSPFGGHEEFGPYGFPPIPPPPPPAHPFAEGSFGMHGHHHPPPPPYHPHAYFGSYGFGYGRPWGRGRSRAPHFRHGYHTRSPPPPPPAFWHRRYSSSDTPDSGSETE
ncbi:hypothetical protein KL942_003640 [Ogataea angusta]|uniref:Uncharacterized protein n=1 Tax=Pichia angusta TaxID=870730 RepID=A0ABQ7RWY3_PICAN|nr:hypothetical protein KL920_003238 [Ogataea angusta]KAG7833263.1 hypothetical protein KL943_004128 [Ogataea angusta]KAG7839278.1 hypothetical protein KL942_003640 [Ogataea angusta]KAG7849611.1 hypothetical protein KL940_002641 [Ogataea angusta]KAG7857851.1 hypothetical protein KL939_003107 [Ogataea angusta]